MTRLSLLALVAGAFVGCSTNYSFKRAENPDGTYDVERLVADLADGPQLYESVGVPFLLDWRVTDFRRETSEEQPASSLAKTHVVLGTEKHLPGHKLSETRDVGPLGVFWSSGTERYYNDSRLSYETRNYRSVLADLWSRDKTVVSTPEGPRTEVQHYLFFGLLPIHRSTYYPETSQATNVQSSQLRVAVSSRTP